MGGEVCVVAQASGAAGMAARSGAATMCRSGDSMQETTEGASQELCLAQSAGGQWLHSSEEEE